MSPDSKPSKEDVAPDDSPWIVGNVVADLGAEAGWIRHRMIGAAGVPPIVVRGVESVVQVLVVYADPAPDNIITDGLVSDGRG